MNETKERKPSPIRDVVEGMRERLVGETGGESSLVEDAIQAAEQSGVRPMPRTTLYPDETFDRMPRFLRDYRPLCTPAEWMVLSALAELTYGWHKESDAVSLSRLSDLTGMSRSHVQRSLEGLERKAAVIRVGQTVVGKMPRLKIRRPTFDREAFEDGRPAR